MFYHELVLLENLRQTKNRREPPPADMTDGDDEQWTPEQLVDENGGYQSTLDPARIARLRP
jgi:hypothetical protein